MHYPLPSHLKELLRVDQARSNKHLVCGQAICPCASAEFTVLYVADRVRENGVDFLRVTGRGENLFLMVAARCRACSGEWLLLDMDFHGWNGYVCAGENIRGVPRPPSMEWLCQQCNSNMHIIDVSINGEDKEFALEEAEGTLTDADWFDGFGWFTLDVTCNSCGRGPSRIVDYETM